MKNMVKKYHEAALQINDFKCPKGICIFSFSSEKKKKTIKKVNKDFKKEVCFKSSFFGKYILKEILNW